MIALYHNVRLDIYSPSLFVVAKHDIVLLFRLLVKNHLKIVMCAVLLSVPSLSYIFVLVIRLSRVRTIPTSRV